ncbi:plasminogen receptor (KT) isoform X1 [Pelobates fuscus]|uniref:plasminogen receptor (KT) isoform X1 n=2 Tax=Pelobates fuscus TaxID=191477 RepID=UPI002FE4743B
MILVNMGSFFSRAVDENMRKQQEFMAMNSQLQLERQIQMQNQMRERQMAMQIAGSREFLKYYGTFFTLAAVGLTAGALKRKNPAFFIPVVPLGFVFAYQLDMGYGTLIRRMKGEAENIIEKENSLLALPNGLPTFESIEKTRKAQRKFSIDE